MVGISGRALQTVKYQLLQAGDVHAEIALPLGDRHLFALAHESGHISGGRPGCRPGERFRRDRHTAASVFVKRLGPIARGGRFDQVPSQSLGIEIDVCDRCEQEFEDGPIDLLVGGPHLGCLVGEHGNALGRVYQKVLQRGRGGVFAANAEGRAAAASTGLFALIAVHRDRAPCSRECRTGNRSRRMQSYRRPRRLQYNHTGGKCLSLTWIKPPREKIVNVIEILHDCDLFSAVEAAGFRRLATIARLVNFRKGQVIFRENDPCPGVFVVGQGLVRVFKTGPAAESTSCTWSVPAALSPKWPPSAAFPCPPRPKRSKKPPACCCRWNASRNALADDHELCRGMMTSMSVWVRRFVMLMEDITFRDAAGRLARYLLELAASKPSAAGTIELPGPETLRRQPLEPHQRDLFSHASPAGRSGLVAEVGKSRVRLLQPKKLRQVAEGLFPKL